MQTAVILTFLVGYLVITLEEPLKINKTATALLTGVICWTFYVLDSQSINKIPENLSHHLAEISEILFFLLGAMTIVELIDAHQGFKIITDRINSKNYVMLLWVISLLTFFLSALLDNLTTAILMTSMLRKIIYNDERRKLFAGVIIIAANAGGAWSPIGDVTTTMLWIGNQITAINIMQKLFLPSLVCLFIPLLYLSYLWRGQFVKKEENFIPENYTETTPTERNILFFAGLGSMLFVPVFKMVTHLPPYMGMLLSLGLVWLIGEILHKEKSEDERQPFSAAQALSRIDVSSILFFLGILLAIGALESMEILAHFSLLLSQQIPNQSVIVLLIGLISAVLDNVPLVAATKAMYDLHTYPTDHFMWEFLAYCAGTGGSILIIGSAPGVAIMGMEKISFGWYLRKIAWLALLGYLGGALVYLFMF